jgi:N utilization substance protein A
MQSQLQAAINQLCAEKNLAPDVIITTIENAIALAYKKDFGSTGLDIKVVLGDDIADMRIYEVRTAVEKINDHEVEIALKDARLVRPDVKVEETVYVPVPPHENFGRIAAQTAKHVINQKIQEAERSMLFSKFKDKEGELLTARVQKVDRDTVLLEIEGITTMLPRRQQIPGEKYFTGQRLKVYLDRVEHTTKGPQLRITRSSNDFITALFEQEIPEMREELVKVARMSREPGTRCKIAVASNDPSIDPVGAFVGQRGSRINTVMEEVGDERLDIIQYSDNDKKLLLAALAPAKVSKVEFYEGSRGDKRVRIFVREEERAMAIGRKGQNVRIAGKLVGMQIDVLTFEGTDEEDEALTKSTSKESKKRKITDEMSIAELSGVDISVVTTLTELGLSQIKQFEGLKAEELAEVGITLEQSTSIINAVQQYIKGN